MNQIFWSDDGSLQEWQKAILKREFNIETDEQSGEVDGGADGGLQERS